MLAVLGLAGCGSQQADGARPDPLRSSSWREATAGDYAWLTGETELVQGFCLTWVANLTTHDVIKRLGAQELQRVSWEQMVGSGDGQRAGAQSYFPGIATVGTWALILEDNDDLGVTDPLVRPLSAGTNLVAYHRDGDGNDRFLVLSDQQVRLDFNPDEPGTRTGEAVDELAGMIDAAGFGEAATVRRTSSDTTYRDYCARSALALMERIVGLPITLDSLSTSTYMLASVPRWPMWTQGKR